MISDKIGIPEALGYSLLGIAVVFLMLIILMAIIGIMGKAMANKKAAAPAPMAPAVPAPAAQAVKKEKAPGTAGNIDLYNVEPKAAAMIMAIVADELGAPINELRFISIKAVD